VKLPARLQLGRVLGIPIELHTSFVLLWAAIFLTDSWPPTLESALTSAAVVALLGGSVILHELGHALAGLREGVRTLGICFYPFGGIAQMAALEVSPRAELPIALAGPAVSIGLAGLFAALSWLAGGVAPEWAGELLVDGVEMNLVLGLFNLTPAFPLDGGRVLRAGLALILPYGRATRIALGIGRAVALLLIGMGPLLNPGWCVLGAVLIVLGSREKRNLHLLEALGRAQVADAMRPVGELLDPERAVAGMPLGGSSEAYLAVVEPGSGHFVGLVRRSHLEAASTAGWSAPIRSLLLPLGLSTHPAAPLGSVVPAMERSGQEAVPVLFGHNVVGILSWAELHRFVLVELEKLASARRNRGWSRLWAGG
jgi:Zn-dependent protease